MNISDIFDRILLRSGQFILRKSNVEIDVDSFRILVEDALSIYNKAYPFTKQYDREVVYPRQLILDSNFDHDMGRAPNWVSEVTPVRYLGNAYSLGSMIGSTPIDGELIDPVHAPWDFNKQTGALTVPYSAYYKIIACYYHQIDEVEDENSGEMIYEVKTITIQDGVFFKLLQGMFLMGIGRSRRSFTLNDLPITVDASEMASEGREMLDEAKEDIKNIQKFYLAMG